MPSSCRSTSTSSTRARLPDRHARTGRADESPTARRRTPNRDGDRRRWPRRRRSLPPYDHAEITAYLGNRIVLEALGGIAWRRKSQRGEAARTPSDPLLEGSSPSSTRGSDPRVRPSCWDVGTRDDRPSRPPTSWRHEGDLITQELMLHSVYCSLVQPLRRNRTIERLMGRTIST